MFMIYDLGFRIFFKSVEQVAAVEGKRLVAPPGLGGQDVDNPVAKTHLGLEHAAGSGA